MDKIIHVNRTVKDGKKKYGYGDIETDIHGWADVNKYRPATYDLCSLKTKDKVLHGWYALGRWDGLKIKDSDEILYWKRKDDGE